MGRPMKTSKISEVDTGYNNPAGALNTYGVVAGDTAQTGPQTLVRVKVGGNIEADGFIIRQKGARKYLVEDASGNQGTCQLVDLADGVLTDNTMTVTVTLDDASTVRMERIKGSHHGLDFSGNPYFLSFNTAYPADTYGAQPYPIVTVESA